MADNNSMQKSFVDWGKATMNTHTPMLVIAVILLVLAFIWLIGLSGVQTGSSTASGFGSIVMSSMNEDMTTINPTYEVISEFFIVLFVILGIGMLTYVLTIKKAASKLIDRGEVYSALIVNGKKDLDAATVTKANKEQLQKEITLLGMPVDTISAGIKALQDKGKATGASTSALVRGDRMSDAYDKSMNKSTTDRSDRIAKQTRKKKQTEHDGSSSDSDDDTKGQS